MDNGEISPQAEAFFELERWQRMAGDNKPILMPSAANIDLTVEYCKEKRRQFEAWFSLNGEQK